MDVVHAQPVLLKVLQGILAEDVIANLGKHRLQITRSGSRSKTEPIEREEEERVAGEVRSTDEDGWLAGWLAELGLTAGRIRND